MEKTRMAPEGASIQAHKDRVFSDDSQPIPCIGCIRWAYCGHFLWTKCARFRIYLHKRREATR